VKQTATGSGNQGANPFRNIDEPSSNFDTEKDLYLNAGNGGGNSEDEDNDKRRPYRRYLRGKFKNFDKYYSEKKDQKQKLVSFFLLLKRLRF